MCDRVYQKFCHHSMVEAMALAEQSDRLRVMPLPPLPPSRYVCEFAVPYLRRLSSGTVEAAPGPVHVGLHFPETYLRSHDPALSLVVASMLTPELFHPNIRGAAICLGASFTPGTPIRHLLWELYDIVSYRNVTLDERNALDPEACRFLRAHPEALVELGPPRPLRRERPRVPVTVESR